MKKVHPFWKDNDELPVKEDDIIQLTSTVNGCDLFKVLYEENSWQLQYFCDMVTLRNYEYDINEVFAPCKYSGEVDFRIIKEERY